MTTDQLHVLVIHIGRCQLIGILCNLFHLDHYLINLFFVFCSKSDSNLMFLLYMMYFWCSYYFFVLLFACFLHYYLLIFCYLNRSIKWFMSLHLLRSMNNRYHLFNFFKLILKMSQLHCLKWTLISLYYDQNFILDIA
jgi:hypothetical protein